MKLKKEYVNKRITVGGYTYDFRNLSEEKIKRIYDSNPNLRMFFEELPKFEEPFETPISNTISKPIDIKKLPKFEEPFETPISNSPGEKWTEETFDKAVKDYISDGDKIKPVPPKDKKHSSIPKPKINEIKKK